MTKKRGRNSQNLFYAKLIDMKCDLLNYKKEKKKKKSTCLARNSTLHFPNYVELTTHRHTQHKDATMLLSLGLGFAGLTSPTTQTMCSNQEWLKISAAPEQKVRGDPKWPN
jgi:hypothetical protein